MAYQMAATAVTLNDLGGHSMTLKVIHRLQAFLNAICRTFVQHFTHAFSNYTYFQPRGLIWLSSVQRAHRVADENRKKNPGKI